MRLDKPELQRVHVTATDGVTRKSKTNTFYDATPDSFFENVERLARADFDQLDQILNELEQQELPAQARPLVLKVRQFIDGFRPTTTAA